MKLILAMCSWRGFMAAAICLLPEASALAYPPAPHHVVYGVARDEFGTPLVNPQALVVLQTPSGVQIAGPLTPDLAPGINYQLEVPMDAGTTADPYQPTALKAAAQFKMFVVVGGVTNLPIQMTGNFSLLGQPGKQTRIDLTLGDDTNGDGIPDDWELAYLAALGLNLNLSSLNANSVLGPSGLSLLQEYLAGYYPFDPADTFTVKLVGFNAGSPILEFTGITGRSYSVLGSSDLHAWTPLEFTVPAEGAGGLLHSYYYSPNVATVRIQAVQPGIGAEPALGFSRAGNKVVFSWPTNAAGFKLLASSSLSAASWAPVAPAPVVAGSQYVVTNTPPGPKQFYRLAGTPVRFFRLSLQ